MCHLFRNQFRVNEQRHLVDNKSAPKRMRIEIMGVRQETLAPDVFETRRMKMASKIGADEVVVTCLPEDRVACLKSFRPR